MIGVFGYFSFGNIFQQVSLRLVTHCAGGFVGFRWGGLGGDWLGNSYWNGFIFDLHNLSNTSHIHFMTILSEIFDFDTLKMYNLRNSEVNKTRCSQYLLRFGMLNITK